METQATETIAEIKTRHHRELLPPEALKTLGERYTAANGTTDWDRLDGYVNELLAQNRALRYYRRNARESMRAFQRAYKTKLLVIAQLTESVNAAATKRAFERELTGLRRECEKLKAGDAPASGGSEGLFSWSLIAAGVVLVALGMYAHHLGVGI